VCVADACALYVVCVGVCLYVRADMRRWRVCSFVAVRVHLVCVCFCLCVRADMRRRCVGVF
jgi:hypothetical protein